MEHALIARRAPARPSPAPAVRSGRAFWIVTFGLAVAIMGNNAPSPIYPVFQARFGFSTGALTLVFAAVVVGVIPSLLFLGPLSDRLGRRPLLLIALALALAGSLGFALATGLGGLLAARALQGLAFGALSGTAVAALVELEPHGDHVRATVVATVTIVASQAVGPLGAGMLAQYAPDPARLSFLVLAGLLLLALAAITIIPETVRTASSEPHSVVSFGVPGDIRAPFAVASLAVIAAFGALGLVSALGPKFVASLLHIHNRAIGGAVVFAMLGASAIAQLAARAARARRQLIAGAAALAVGLLVVLAGVAAHSLAIFLAGIALAGVGQGLAYLGAQELLDSVVPAGVRGGVMSAFFLVLYLAAALAALAVGLTAGPLGLRGATIIAAAALAALAVASGLLSQLRVAT